MASTKAPSAPMASAWERLRNDGIKPIQIRYWATAMLASDQAIIDFHRAEPHVWSSCRAMKA